MIAQHLVEFGWCEARARDDSVTLRVHGPHIENQRSFAGADHVRELRHRDAIHAKLPDKRLALDPAHADIDRESGKQQQRAPFAKLRQSRQNNIDRVVENAPEQNGHRDKQRGPDCVEEQNTGTLTPVIPDIVTVTRPSPGSNFTNNSAFGPTRVKRLSV